ncbi:alpha/beta-hydrolase [Teratosphaeria nubilosa]|uniref:triacylglycerol lipase n=1 Tax=Teratosphaeria nubilosa TaxID=161662 RepID=A0A6G1L9T8_9PEZI|nr:alpha/beta-hydrolase [Teratosphaeria nubilosa]
MLQFGDTLLLLLLLLLLLPASAHAARTPPQRRPDQTLFPFLPPATPDDSGQGKQSRAQSLGDKEFTLRHIYHHGTHDFPHLHRYIDVQPEAELSVSYDNGETYEPAERRLSAQAMTTTIPRLAHRTPSDIDRLLDHAYTYGEAASLPSYAWVDDEIPAPNISNKHTVLTFAKMAANAYVQDHLGGEWKDVKGGFNYTDDFGWQQDGLRGHIFADQTNKTIVIGLKGTSPAVFDGADTTGNDKLNDNLFGSCCCGQGGPYMWKQVCNCKSSNAYTCNSTCLVKSLRDKGHYYRSVRDLYHNVTERYPDVEDVWLSGHSLGGVVASLLGLTYGLPTLTFEAYPDAMAASRLGLPMPPGYRIGAHQNRRGTGIYHFGHTADPIYMGTANGATSVPSIAGYAFEGVCHTGQTCTYDTVGDLGWRVGIGTHKINSVIKDVLMKYDTVPECEEDVDCQDCYNWKFFKSNGTEPITSSVSSSTTTSTRTRTETCKTPGWWGCLDETTTSMPMTSTSTSSSTSSSTCRTPGWFGCRDATTTTSSSTSTSTTAAPAPTITTTSSLPTSTSTCRTPGWFGCNDPTTTVPAQPAKTVVSTTPTATTQPKVSSAPTPGERHCIERHWYGSCKEYEEVVKGELR